MPYKIHILPFLDFIEREAEIIGAVNCLYRKGDKIVGANTDGAGALWSIEKESEGGLSGKRVLLLGSGGAGFAVAAYIASALGNEGRLLIANRSKDSRDKIVQRLKEKCIVESVKEWPVLPETLKQIDIIVNCSSIGFETFKKDKEGKFYSLKYYSPLGYFDDSIRVQAEHFDEKIYVKLAIENINKNFQQTLIALSEAKKPLVFDIIYQPRETLLLYLSKLLGYKTLNGLAMNLEQAVIAFARACSSAGLFAGDRDRIRSVMAEI